MSYIVKSLTVENAGPFIDRQTISFATGMLNVIEGKYTDDSKQSNGSGKTFICDLLTLALFNKGIRSQYIADYISDTNRDGGIYISVCLENPQTSDSIVVERWRRPAVETTKAKVTINGNVASQNMTMTQIDELIQSHIGVTYNNFLSSMFSTMLAGFLKYTASKRFEILESALSLKRIESVLKRVNTSIRTTTERLAGITEALLTSTGELGKQEARYELYSANVESLTNTIAEQEDKIKAALVQEAAYNQRRVDIDKLIDDILVKVDARKTLIETAQRDKEDIERSLAKIAKSLSLIDSGIKRSGDSLECVICHSSVSDESKDGLKQHYLDERAELDGKLSDITAVLKGHQKRLAEIESTYRTATATKQSNEAAIRGIYVTTLSAEQLIKQSREALSNIKLIADQTILDKLREDVSSLRSQQKQLQKDIDMLNSWKQALSKNGLRLSYIKAEVGTLSSLATLYASQIYGHEMKVSFFIANESDNPNLDFTVNGKSAAMFSTGESRRLEIAITLSLLSLLKTAGMNINTLILDEALDGLSAASKERMVRIIHDLAQDNQIFLISHDEILKNAPGNIITVIKDRDKQQSTVVTSLRSDM